MDAGHGGAITRGLIPKPLLKHLQDKRERSARKADSPFGGFSRGGLPMQIRSRVCTRGSCFGTSRIGPITRTVIASLVPSNVFLTNKGPHLLFARGTLDDQAFVLGVLSSIPLDWYARRFVETTLNFFIFNPFPIPRPLIADPLRRRVIDIAARLATPDDRFKEWASHFKLEPKVLDAETRRTT